MTPPAPCRSGTCPHTPVSIMPGTYGLYGHIRHHASKSMALLSGFVALITLFFYAWCVVYVAVVDVYLAHRIDRYRGYRHKSSFDFDLVGNIFSGAFELALDKWWLPLVLSALWFWVAYMVHADMIRLATGARPVSRKEQPKLYNLVENLAISAGLPMPRVEIMNTGALNAYAAGLSPDDAVVAVTRGLLQTLTDDELEAVLAHEMTHIKNFDVRLMVIASCFAGGLTLLGDGVAKMFQNTTPADGSTWSPSQRADRLSGADAEDAGNLVAVLISVAVAVVFFCLAHLMAILIPLAISRAREFMADAGATELTKNPDALISALEKICQSDEIPNLSSTLKPMMISSSIDGLYATHPPVETRIMALKQYAGGRLGARPKRATTRAAQQAGTIAAPAVSMGFGGVRPVFGRRQPSRA